MTSNQHQEIILDSDKVRASLPALTSTLDSLDAQTFSVVRHLEEAQRGDPHKYLSGGISEGFDAGGTSQRAAAELRDVIDRVYQTLNAFDHHDRNFRLVHAASPAPTSSQSVPSVCTDEELLFPSKEDYVDKDDYGSEPPPDSENLINKLLELELPWWLDAGLSFFAIGDIIDIIRQQIINRFAGKEPDNLITAIAVFGLVADAGWLQPIPSVEDAPNAILALLKTIAKRLPKGKTRDYLAELIEKAAKNPDDLKRLVDFGVALSKHQDILEKLIANPKVMRAALEGGSEFVELLAKYGDEAFDAAQILGKHAPNVIKQYDEIAHLPGSDRILKDLQVGGTITSGAVGEIRYFRSIKDDVAEVALRSSDGQKAADAVLKDGTIIDVKNWDFQRDFYQNPASLDKAIDKLLDQVDLRRAQYPGQPIKYVFTSPLDQVPASIKEALTEADVILEGMP
ncbi:MAG TPA: hypothetical protein PKD53_00675 [Chloroflexaceae bacterium]|nr:hypothetical protein [Chloroflexaceae bacterium]